MADHNVQVLIVGGSLVGMSTALLLAHHGVDAMAVEHHRGTAIHPRAAQITQRTMEIFREVGIERIVWQKSGEQFVQDGAIMAVETLAGREVGYFIANLNEGIRDVSPCERVFISQSLLEPLLKTRAEELGASLRFGTDVTSFEQDAGGVTATIQNRDTGRTETVRATYMVAADGTHSRSREQLGIGMQGRGVFSHSVTIYFRANVASLLRGRNLSVIYVNNDALRGFFRFEKPFDRGFLAVNALGDPTKPVTDVATGLTEERCLEWVRLALGSDEVPIEIENVMPWKASADVADRFRDGRVFLAGDAAHVMPPNGGWGGNTGVQDAHNLAWKLAMVLQGAADPALLATYEQERRPVGHFTTEQAYARYVTRTAPYLGTEGLPPIAPDLNVELGYRYDSPAVCLDGPAVPHDDPRTARGRPGARAPHVWLSRGGDRISTLDLLGRRFVVLGGPESSSWCGAVDAVRRQRGLAMDVHRIGLDGLADPDGTLLDTYGISPRDIVLVRPDGFVGWRSKTAVGSPSAVAGALAQLTFRDMVVS
jgi:2-polyprenyl-6-methoxyphenol hydroxylase-like FAD-dependent oxidoreductase